MKRIFVPIEKRCTLSFDEAAEYSGLDVKEIGDMICEPGNDMLIMVGNRRRIKRKKLEAYILRKIEEKELEELKCQDQKQGKPVRSEAVMTEDGGILIELYLRPENIREAMMAGTTTSGPIKEVNVTISLQQPFGN